MEKIQLTLVNGRPLYLQLAEAIKQYITSNTWQQGMMIPSETELSKTCDVSVGTVKKTLDMLAQEGYVIRHQGKGTFVAGPDFSKSFTRFFRYSDENATPLSEFGSKTLGKSVIQSDKTVAKALGLDVGEKVFYLHRLRTSQSLNLAVEKIYLPYERFRGIEHISLTDALLYPIYQTHFNTPVVWADEYLQAVIADTDTAHLLKIDTTTPVIGIERIAYTSRDVPIEFRQHIGRGDHFKYHIVVR